MNKILKSSYALIMMAIFSFVVACNTSPEAPKTKELPEEALVEEEVSVETKAEDRLEEKVAVNQTAVMQTELMALEAALEATTPSRAKAEDNPETPVQKCMRRCEKILDNSQNSNKIGSGAQAIKAHEQCLENCAELEALAKQFQECIKDAKTEEAKKACRKIYMENRPWSHTE